MKKKTILSLVLAAFLLVPSVSMAANSKYKNFALKAGGKMVKRIVLPATLLLTATAHAAEEYSNGGTAGDIFVAGVGGAKEKVVESIVETAQDASTISSAAYDFYKSATE
jgi:hypothetical protein